MDGDIITYSKWYLCVLSIQHEVKENKHCKNNNWKKGVNQFSHLYCYKHKFFNTEIKVQYQQKGKWNSTITRPLLFQPSQYLETQICIYFLFLVPSQRSITGVTNLLKNSYLCLGFIRQIHVQLEKKKSPCMFSPNQLYN